jgi:hypothetical protein
MQSKTLVRMAVAARGAVMRGSMVGKDLAREKEPLNAVGGHVS